MEQESFFSGYCRMLDQSRMVTVITADGSFLEADCSYENCPYAPGCPIAEKIRDLLK